MVKAKSKSLFKGKDKLPPPKTENEKFAQFKIELDEAREQTALKRLGIDVLFNREWRKIVGFNYEYYLFKLGRETIINNPPDLKFLHEDLFKPEFRGKAELYKYELSMYAHMVYHDYKTFPSQTLKDMLSNIKSAYNSIYNATREIIQHTNKSRSEQKVKEKYKIGLASGLPNNFNTKLYEEFDIIRRQLTHLGAIISKDQQHKLSKTKTPKKAKIQYFLFLARELYNMLDWSKFHKIKKTNLTKDEIHKYIETFTFNILDNLNPIKDSEDKDIINSFEWNLTSQEKKKIKPIKQFHNLVGCTNEAQFLKIKKAINF